MLFGGIHTGGTKKFAYNRVEEKEVMSLKLRKILFFLHRELRQGGRREDASEIFSEIIQYFDIARYIQLSP